MTFAEKEAVRARSRHAVMKGRLKRRLCEVCGAHAQMHHEDYSKHLDVTWLCSLHHTWLHAYDMSIAEMRALRFDARPIVAIVHAADFRTLCWLVARFRPQPLEVAA